MNTWQLEEILKKDKYASGVFCGVKARDQFIQESPTFPAAYIVNTDNSTQPGTHWISVWLTHENTVEYFDSYGNGPLFIDLAEKLNALSPHIKYNNFRLQGYTTTVCGHYCLLFCLLRARGFPFDTVINTFKPDMTNEGRDHLIAEFVEDRYLNTLVKFDKDFSSDIHLYPLLNALCKY